MRPQRRSAADRPQRGQARIASLGRLYGGRGETLFERPGSPAGKSGCCGRCHRPLHAPDAARCRIHRGWRANGQQGAFGSHRRARQSGRVGERPSRDSEAKRRGFPRQRQPGAALAHPEGEWLGGGERPAQARRPPANVELPGDGEFRRGSRSGHPRLRPSLPGGQTQGDGPGGRQKHLADVRGTAEQVWNRLAPRFWGSDCRVPCRRPGRRRSAGKPAGKRRRNGKRGKTKLDRMQAPNRGIAERDVPGGRQDAWAGIQHGEREPLDGQRRSARYREAQP